VTHASESQHWYARTGQPAYTVKSRDGSDRPATLRDARKIGLVPGVSTILGCCDKPGLTHWKIEQAILSALTLPRVDGETSDAFIARVKHDAKETARKAAERGTGIHAAIQGFYEGEGIKLGYEDHIRGAVAAVAGWAVGGWKAEQSFAHPLGFGGKVDLHGVNATHLLDFKSKEFGPDTRLETWPEQHMQLAAYREGLGMGMARCAIVYVSATVPGLSKLIEVSEDDLSQGWECFVYLLGFWQARNRLRCGWKEEKQAA
jgi:hypothetical protein